MGDGNRRSESVVVVARTPSVEYNRVDFRQLLEQSAADLEQAGVELPRRGSVFIKPNLVVASPATEGITTDPHLIFELIGLLKRRGVEAVYVGESSAGFQQSSDVFKDTGMGEAVARAGGIVVDINEPSERLEVSLGESDILESISIPRKALEADCLINFAKVKTHRIGSFTCAVKNWVGFIEQPVRLHNHQTRLPKLVAELHRVLPEHLCFGDAVIVGEGDGPDLNRPRFLGVLLASNDPVAMDSIGAELLGIHRHDLLFPWTAHLDGIGEIDRNRIRVVGYQPEEIGIRVSKPMGAMYNRFPCHIVLGGVCEGCFAWFMGPALSWQREGIWEQMGRNVGRPTFMLGFNAVDRNFEQHVDEGPYFVIGDCTPRRFQNDPRTVYIPGCCPGPAIPDIVLETCKVNEEQPNHE